MKGKKLSIFFSFSVFLHLLFFLLILIPHEVLKIKKDKKLNKTNSILKSRILSDDEYLKITQKKSIVTSKKTQKPAPQLQKKTTHQAAFTQRVKKETQSKIKKHTLPQRNSVKSSAKKQNSFGLTKKTSMSKETSKTFSGSGTLTTQFQSNDLLNEDIAISSETILNTDEFKHASFINRLKDQVSPYWEELVLSLENKENSPFVIPGRYLTRASFSISPSGDIEKIHLKRKSGIQDFDFIAEKSLKKIKNIMNVPDEKNHFEFTFLIHVHNSGLLNIQPIQPRRMSKARNLKKGT